MNKSNLLILAWLPAALLAVSGCKSTPQMPTVAEVLADPAPEPAAPASPVFIGSGATAGTSSGMVRVVAVDPHNRTALLIRPDGTTAAYKAGPAAVNFDQIKAGDQLMTTMTEDFVAYLVKGGVPPGSITNVVVTGKPKGSSPGGVMIRTVDYNAKVLTVDYTTRRVLLQYGANEAKTVVAGPNVNLAALNAGDSVLIRTTEALAVAVVKP